MEISRGFDSVTAGVFREHILKDKAKLRTSHERKAKELLQLTLGCTQFIRGVKVWLQTMNSARLPAHVPHKQLCSAVTTDAVFGLSSRILANYLGFCLLRRAKDKKNIGLMQIARGINKRCQKMKVDALYLNLR